jgi:N-acetylmuramoyl-L-alanine amidase
MAVIVTAAGHGGSDIGAPNPFNPSRPEKVINLEIDEAFSRFARAAGHTVHRVRTGDTRLSPSEMIATAKNTNADVVIEIHVNASISPTANGVEVWALPDYKRLAELTSRNIASSAGFYNRGFRNALNHAYIGNNAQQLRERPYIVTENGFITNPRDEMLLRDPRVINAIAQGHLAGIHLYLGLPVVPRLSWLLLLPVLMVGTSLALSLRKEE